MTDRRRIIIEWSPMDDEYVAYTQDAPAISALGESRGEALRELEVVLMMVEEGVDMPAVT